MLRVPVRPGNIIADWCRLAANAINQIIVDIGKLKEAGDAGYQVFKPLELPVDPEIGTTILDQDDNVLKTWDGTSWKNHW